MIILDYRIKFIFIFYIYIFSCVKIWVNPVLTRPLKDRVWVISCATRLGRPVFWPKPIWPEPTWVELEPDWPDPFARSNFGDLGSLEATNKTSNFYLFLLFENGECIRKLLIRNKNKKRKKIKIPEWCNVLLKKFT